MSEYYQRHHANVHRSVYALAAEATDMFDAARRTVARFIGAPSDRGVIFTKNVTEAINLVAYSWGRANLKPGDAVLLTEMEHHANIVPRSEEHTSALQSLMRLSYAVFCLN